MRIILAILLIASTAVAERVPTGYQKWDHPNRQKEFQFGGSIQNYPDSTGWHQIENNWILDGDSIYVARRSVLKATATPAGEVGVILPWKGSEYTTIQTLQSLKWFRVTDSASLDIDTSPQWSNIEVDSNIIKWTNVFPGVDYRVRKSNGSVAHGIFFKPPFLDSMVTLLDQRPDSSNLYLANVMTYNLSSNIDDWDQNLGNIRKRRLKSVGSFVFELAEQRVSFPGYDTLPEVPVWQRHRFVGNQLYVFEFVKATHLRRIHQAYPNATISHNASFTISDSLGESGKNYSFGGSAQNNYGGATTDDFGMVVLNSRYQNVLYKFPTLRDSMDAVGAATWDSALFKVVATAVNGLNATDTIYSTIHKITQLWDEGTADGSATGGATWDSASATGSGGSEPNSPLDWTSDGGDYVANGEDQPTTDTTHFYALGDSVVFWNGGISQFDTLVYRISGATVADTLDEGLILVSSRQSASGTITFAANENSTTTYRPKILVYYTVEDGAADAAYTRRTRMVED